MTRAPRRSRLLLPFLVALISLLAVLWWRGAADELAPRRDRPVLLLLTSLPVMFGEELSLEAAGSPLLDALETRYRVQAIATTSPQELARGRLLLMAQPLAQPAENLVALDHWVRDGGRVLLSQIRCSSGATIAAWRRDAAAADVHRHGLLGHWGAARRSGSARGAHFQPRRQAVATISRGAWRRVRAQRRRAGRPLRIGEGEAMAPPTPISSTDPLGGPGRIPRFACCARFSRIDAKQLIHMLSTALGRNFGPLRPMARRRNQGIRQ